MQFSLHSFVTFALIWPNFVSNLGPLVVFQIVMGVTVTVGFVS